MKAVFALALALLLGGCVPAFDLNQPATVVEAVHQADGWNCYLVKTSSNKHTPRTLFYVYSRKHYQVGDSVALVTVVEVKP